MGDDFTKEFDDLLAIEDVNVVVKDDSNTAADADADANADANAAVGDIDDGVIIDNDPIIADDPVVDDVDPIIVALQEQNANLVQMMEKVLKGTEPEPEPEPEPVDPFTMDSFANMVKTMEWDVDEVNSFKDFFSSYMDQHSENVVKQTMKMTPDIVSNAISAQNKLENTAKKFYDNNPALAHVKGYIKALANEVAREGGGKSSIEDVLSITAERAYNVLGIEKGEIKLDDPKAKDGKKPAFASSKGARKKASKKTALQSELDEILDLTF